VTAEPPFGDDDLHAAADDRLPAEREPALDAFLSAHPAEKERVGFYRRLNAELHALFDPVLAEPVRWTRPPRRWRPAVRIAAAVALLLAGAASGWFARDLATEPAPARASLPRLAASAHAAYAVEVRHPVEVPAAEEGHLAQWLSKRLGDPVRIPSLGAVGYDFLGGRLLPDGDGIAAQLMYQNDTGNRVTLYFRPVGDAEATAFRYLAEGRLSIFYWQDREFSYALVSELPRQELLAVCNEVYAQLNPNSPAADW
jgi:anti-sigma factor RsiW